MSPFLVSCYKDLKCRKHILLYVMEMVGSALFLMDSINANSKKISSGFIFHFYKKKSIIFRLNRDRHHHIRATPQRGN